MEKMAVDPAKELRRAVDTGKVGLGFKETKRNILKGSCLLVIIGKGVEKGKQEALEGFCSAAGIPYYEFNAKSAQLGSICGKPFSVSFACVTDMGKSKLLEAVEKKKTGQ